MALSLKKPTQAESLAILGLGIRQKVYGPKSVQVASQLQNVAYFAEARGDTSAAIPLIRESLSLLASRPPTDPSVINARRQLAIDLCATGATVGGDSVIRATIDRLPLDSTQVMPYRVRDVLGFCLTRARRFAEAEPLLLLAEAGLRRLSPAAARHHNVAVTWLVSLYEQWGKAEEAALWKERLGRRP